MHITVHREIPAEKFPHPLKKAKRRPSNTKTKQRHHFFHPGLEFILYIFSLRARIRDVLFMHRSNTTHSLLKFIFYIEEKRSDTWPRHLTIGTSEIQTEREI